MLALDRWKLIGWRLLQFVPVIVMVTCGDFRQLK